MNTNRGERLSRYAHPQRNQLFPDVLDDFNDVVQRSPEKVIAQAMAAAFRADENTPFAPIVANLFRHSDAELRAALVNILVSHVGHETNRVLSNAGLFGFDPESKQVTEGTTTQLSPEGIGVVVCRTAPIQAIWQGFDAGPVSGRAKRASAFDYI